MGAPSTIKRLPPAILERLQELLRDPSVLQCEAAERINELLAQDGYQERISKSAVNRYDLQMRDVGAKLDQSRQVAAMWIGKMGATPQGQVGNLVNEILRTLAFDISLKLQDMELNEETMPEVVSQLRHLSLVAMRLEKAASENVKREAEIKKQALAEAAEAAGKVARSLGITAETIAKIHNEILGI